MNIVWFGPAFIGSILTFFSVTRPIPPTPPSREALMSQMNLFYNFSNGIGTIEYCEMIRQVARRIIIGAKIVGKGLMKIRR